MAVELNEKDELLQRQLDLELNANNESFKARKANCTRRFMQLLLVGLISVLGFVFLGNKYDIPNQLGCPSVSMNLWGMFAAPVTPPPTVLEIFEIQPDYTIPLGVEAFNTTLFNESALVDGLSAKYHPTNVSFDTGLLTLNITNGQLVDSKTPIVAEITVEGAPVWRFSTPMSKFNTITTSSTVKNITEILSLFESKAKFSVNILEGAKDAKDINSTLVLSLFNETTTAAAAPVTDLTPETIFSASGPADVVFPLTNKGKPFNLPADKFSVALPQLNSNTSVAKLSLFASATEEEVSYFKNDIAAVGAPGSNGPLRYLNVYINDVYVSSVSPKPTLFHSQEISKNDNTTKLWEPLADSGSLQGLSYDLDLISVLPLLWAGDAKLDIEVVSPISSANKPAAPGVAPALPHPVVPGEQTIVSKSWFVSGNLLAWESDAIVSAVGDVLIGESSEMDSGILIAPPAVSPWQPKMKNQIVKTSIDGGIISQFNFTLIDDSLANYTVEFNSSTHAFLTKQTKEIKKAAGPPGSGLGSTTTSSSLTLVTGIKNKINILDTATNTTLYTKKVSFDFPFTFSETTTDSTTMFKGPSSTESVKASINSDIKTKVNGVKTSAYKVKEKLTLDDILGASTDIKVQIENVNELPFEREVAATNGIITKDTSVAALATLEEFDLSSEDLQSALDLFM